MSVVFKNVVSNIVNGTFAQNICLVCLLELDERKENIFTKVCKDDVEYCVADVLISLFNVQVFIISYILDLCDYIIYFT